MRECTISVACSWYVISTRSNCEKSASQMLVTLGIVHYLPLIEEVKRWSDRTKVISAPLFPGYLFVQIDGSAESQLVVRKVPGVVSFIANREGPVAVEDHEVHRVRTLLDRGVRCSQHTFLENGDRVRVIRGPLSGLEGTFLRSGAQSSLVISVQAIRQAVSVSVAASDIEAVVE